MDPSAGHEPARTQPNEDISAEWPEKKAAFEIPLHHRPTRLEDIPEHSDSCPPRDGAFDETLEVSREDTVNEEPASPPQVRYSNYSDFYEAIIRGDIESIKRHLDLGANIERETNDCFSPLVIALMESQVDVVKVLLDKGANVHHRCKRLPTLVHAAMKEQRGPEMMQLLLDRGAILNSISGPDGKTALHWAASEGMAKSVEFLISKGMDIEAMCTRGRTPVILAAEAGHTNVVKVLWAHGADLHARSENGGTALIWAACRDQVEVVNFLLAQGVDVDRKDKNGHTALSLASHFANLAVVKQLLAYDANVNVRSNEPKGCTPAMAAACSGSIAVLKALIAHGANLSLQSAHGDSVLDIALIERNENVVRLLLEAMGGENYPEESVAMQIAMADSHSAIMGLMTTASIMHSYMEIKLGEPDKYAWMDWVLKQGGELLEPSALWKMMHAALEERDLPLVKTLLNRGCDVNRRLESGHSPLSFAVSNVRCSNLRLVQTLLDAGADPNQEIPDREGMSYTPFDHAIIDLDWHGPPGKGDINTEVVDVLLKSGRCKINKGRNARSTAFSFVLSKSEDWGTDVADALAIRMIDSIPNVNEDRDELGCTLLHVAVQNGREDFIDLLLSRGADIEACTDKGSTPLILACQHSPEMLPILLDRGANVSAMYESNATALHAAAANGYLEAVKLLVKCGLDVNATTYIGFTPLSVALKGGYEATALYLLSEGADASVCTALSNQTALHMAARSALPAAVDEILKQNVIIDAKDDKGWTPLHEAAACGTPAIVSTLLDAGANIELPLLNGDRPLHVALVNENEVVAQQLIDRGADIVAGGAKGRTALHEAAHYNLPRIAEYLIEKEPKLLGTIDDDTWSPLCVCGHPHIVRMLIDNGANIHYADKDGWTALHQAIDNGDVEVAKILVAAGARTRDRTTDDGLSVYERAVDMYDWYKGVLETLVHPMMLTSCVAQRNVKERRRRMMKERLEENARAEEEEKKKADEEALQGLGEKYELVEAIEE